MILLYEMINKSFVVIIVPLIIGLVLHNSPWITTHVIMILDLYTPWSQNDSIWYKQYHLSLIDQLPDIKPKKLYEIPVNELTNEELRKQSNDFTLPVIIRNVIKNETLLNEWNNISWWINNYGNEEVLCKSVSGSEERRCTIAEALSPSNITQRSYISGDATLLKRRPELGDVVNDNLVNL